MLVRKLLGLKHLVANSCKTMFNTSQQLHGELVETFLNLEKLDVNLYRSKHQMPNPGSTVIYGGQVIGQSLVAALKTVQPSLKPHSLHCYFLKAGNSDIPILYNVDRVRDGKSFATRGIKAVQEGETIFSCQISFHVDEPDSIVHQQQMPVVKLPEEIKEYDVLLQEQLLRPDLSESDRQTIQRKLELPRTFSVRPVDPEGFLRIKATEPKQYLWVKSKTVIGTDPLLQLAVAAYISDFAMVWCMLLPHVAAGFRVGLALSLDHSMWFHRYKFRIDEDWLLYEIESPVACGSRGFAHGKLWTRNGELLLSTAQEGLIRPKL